MDLFIAQFSLKVLDVMKTAEQALTVSEYTEFLESVKRLAEEKLVESGENEKDTSGIMVKVGWVRDVLDILKDHVEKPPRNVTKIGGLKEGFCPNCMCNAEINNVSNAAACGYCGQAVKWE